MKKLGGLLAIAGLAGLASAATWVETGDAGDLVGSAQHPAGSGSLDHIVGFLGFSDADMYCIHITDPAAFSATTFGGPMGFDSQLFLFTPGAMGVLANDDFFGLQAALPVGSFGGPAGMYYLAISGFDYDPTSAGGLIFPTAPFGGVYGPTGPGGGSAHTGWSGTGGGGDYDITLTGAEFCMVIPLPTGAGLGMAGLIGLAAFRRRHV